MLSVEECACVEWLVNIIKMYKHSTQNIADSRTLIVKNQIMINDTYENNDNELAT